MWQDIKSAPKDGVRVLLWDGTTLGIGSYMRWDRDSEGRVTGFESTALLDHWLWDGEGFEAYPTHWMELPAEPDTVI